LSATDGSVGPWSWFAALVVVAAFAAMTGFVALRNLRVPYRAEQVGWRYVYGFYDLERASDGSAYRWTSEKAIDVMVVKGPWLKLTLGGPVPPDIAGNPITVTVSGSRGRILRVVRRDGVAITRYIRTPPAPSRMMIEIDVSRTWRPSDFNSSDVRRLGVAVDEWSFVTAPPPGATVID
jgi:hypothetical protein